MIDEKELLSWLQMQIGAKHLMINGNYGPADNSIQTSMVRSVQEQQVYGQIEAFNEVIAQVKAMEAASCIVPCNITAMEWEATDG